MKTTRYIQLLRLLLFFCLYIHSAKAQHVHVFDQLAEVNKEWLKLPDVDPALKTTVARPLTEQELIRQHLQQVEKLLRSRSTTHLSPAQKANREKHLNTLHQYWQAGRFPKNTFHKERRPYFIDIFNTYCAVGYLMQQSGADAMARDINRNQNFSYLRDIRHPGLGEWVKASGLSLDELALIQPSYSCYPTSIVEIHYNNSGIDQNEYIEVVQAPDALGPAFLSAIDFYDHTGLLYKTLLSTSMSTYSIPTRLGGVDSYQFYYYLFPVGESLADSGMIKLRSFFGDISTFVYNSAGVTVTQHVESSSNPWGTVKTYPVIEDGTGPSNITLNFCGDCITATRYNSLMPATYAAGNLICHALLPLPGFHQFSYTLLNKKVRLNWSTETETGTRHFEIERSGNGRDFTAIGQLAAAGNSSSTKSYQFTDNNPLPVNYYRLKQKDQDGTFTYSKTLLVKIKTGGGLNVYPTLVTDQLRVQPGNGLQYSGKLELIDVQGRVLQQYTVQPGLNEINISSLQKGSYFLRIQTDKEGVLTGRFVKQ